MVEELLREWRANARRWEAVAARVRAAGLQVWNPGLYAAAPYAAFLKKYPPRKGALLALGLNPSPHGMAQTGVPFTDCRTAGNELGLGLEIPGRAPADLVRRLRKPNGKWRSTYERSGLILYRALKYAWGDLPGAFSQWYMGNPCPLLFLDPKGWNVTPADPRLKAVDGMQGLRVQAVTGVARILQPRGVVCLGADVAAAVGDVADGLVGEKNVIRFKHPARAVPLAWAEELKKELRYRNLLLA